MLWLLTAMALATGDDLVVPLEAPDRYLVDTEGVRGLPVAHGQADLANYSIGGVMGGTYHRWHGRVGGDITLFSVGPNAAFRMGLTTQTVADYQNSISFRLVRMYYDATAIFERRLGPGVLGFGYRHRCTHGTDDAVDGRITFRSGPELAYGWSWTRGAVTVTDRSFVHLTLVGQNADPDFKPRMMPGTAMQVEWRWRSMSLFASGGTAVALIGDVGEYNYGIATPWGGVSTLLLPAVASGIGLHGEGASFRLLLHAERILDSGFGDEGDPTFLASVQPQLTW